MSHAALRQSKTSCVHRAQVASRASLRSYFVAIKIRVNILYPLSLCFLPAAVQKGKHAHRRVLTAKLYFVHVRTQRWKMFLLLLTSSAIFFAIAFFIGLPLVSALDFIVSYSGVVALTSVA